MSKTAIVCTSTSGLTEQDNLPQLRVLPLHVLLGERDLLDCVQLSPAKFYRWAREHPNQIATSSPPHPSEIRSLFDSLIREGYTQVLVLTLSAKFSQTYAIVQNVALEYRWQIQIQVFDTQTGGIAEALLAIEALRQVQRGAALPGIITRLKLLGSKARTFMTVGKLSHLVRAGRLSAPAGFIGELLNLHPVLHIEDGEIKPLLRVRTMERALEQMAQAAAEFASGVDSKYEWHILEADATHASALLQDIMKTQHGIIPTSIAPMTSVIAANTGIDGVGLVLWSPR